MNFFQGFLFNLLGHTWSPFFSGVLPDVRTTDEKQKDYLHSERAPVAVANPFGNAQIVDSPYPYENQNSTSSCVPHGVGLALAIERQRTVSNYQRLSWIFNYRQRSNYPQEGTALQDSFNNYRHYGAPFFTTLPDPQEEAEANAITLTTREYTEAAPFKGLTYFTFDVPNDIATLANVAAQGHGIAIFLYATYDEYARQYPQATDPSVTQQNAEVRHCVCVLPNSGFIKDGVRYLAVQDSSLFAGWHVRYLSEAFIHARVYAGGYWLTVAATPTNAYPKHIFTIPLRRGDRGQEVTYLQQLLVAEGMLPADCVTGFLVG